MAAGVGLGQHVCYSVAEAVTALRGTCVAAARHTWLGPRGTQVMASSDPQATTGYNVVENGQQVHGEQVATGHHAALSCASARPMPVHAHPMQQPPAPPLHQRGVCSAAPSIQRPLTAFKCHARSMSCSAEAHAGFAAALASAREGRSAQAPAGIAGDRAWRCAVQESAGRRSHPCPGAEGPRRGLHGSGMVSVMTAAESARDLLAAVTQPVSYSELASHLERDYSLELFDALSGLVTAHMEELNGPALSNLLWAYTTVGHRDLGLATMLMQSLQPKLQELGPTELANALWALTRLGIYEPQFVLAASERVWEMLPAATPRQLSALLQSYAWFRQHDPDLEDDEDLLRSISDRLRAEVANASATDLALALSGLARLRRADGALLGEACAVLQGEASSTGLPVLAEVVWACALLQYRELGFLEVLARRVVEAVQRAMELMPVPQAMASGVRSSLPLPLRPSGERRGAVASSTADAAAAGQDAAQSAGGAGGSQPGSKGAQAGPAPGLLVDSPAQFSALWPTHLGPGGHSNPCTLYEQFNPALPDDWQSARSTSSRSPQASAANDAEGVLHSRLASASPEALADAGALQDADVLSKLLWSFSALHCYSGPLYTLLFRQLPHLRFDRTSWSALARLLGAQLKAYELQPSSAARHIKPLEAVSVTAWGRLMRAREPLHKLPSYLLPAAFVAFQAETDGRDFTQARAGATQRPEAPRMPGTALSRRALEAEVVSALHAMGLKLRPSSTVDGMFNMEHTMMINGLSICVEVLSADCCVLEPPHWPMGPAVGRLRSLMFRGWTPLVVPFNEWAALEAEEGPAAREQLSQPDGGDLSAAQREAAAAAQQRYLRRKLEEVLGEEPPTNPQAAPKRRAA